jgi:hypothetical protein
MVRNPLRKKCLVVGIILLFGSLFFAPSINSNVVIATNDNDQVQNSGFSGSMVFNKSVCSLFSLGKKSDSIVWNNYGYSYGSNALASQLDSAYPLNCQVADDFFLENDCQVTGVHWWGVFFGGDPPWPNPCDFNIIFYADDGTGNMPTGAGMEDPTSTALAVYFIPQVNGTLVGSSNSWFEYDVFLPIGFTAMANTKYWIAIQAVFPIFPQWGWGTNGPNPDQLHEPVQGFPLLGTPYWTIEGYGDMAFYLFGYHAPQMADLDCRGSLAWSDVKPGETITGNFQIMNVGEPDSLLNWTIASFPDWGTWTFSPASGMNLIPQNGPVTVNVSVIAPDIKDNAFQGQVIIVNSDNASDFYKIPVSLMTPLNTGIMHDGFMVRLLIRFSYAFSALRQFLQYVTL